MHVSTTWTEAVIRMELFEFDPGIRSSMLQAAKQPLVVLNMYSYLKSVEWKQWFQLELWMIILWTAPMNSPMAGLLSCFPLYDVRGYHALEYSQTTSVAREKSMTDDGVTFKAFRYLTLLYSLIKLIDKCSISFFIYYLRCAVLQIPTNWSLRKQFISFFSASSRVSFISVKSMMMKNNGSRYTADKEACVRKQKCKTDLKCNNMIGHGFYIWDWYLLLGSDGLRYTCSPWSNILCIEHFWNQRGIKQNELIIFEWSLAFSWNVSFTDQDYSFHKKIIYCSLDALIVIK